MNQILEFGTEKRGKAPKGSGGSASDKIVKVFAILLMIFAVVLIGSGVYSLLKNKEEAEAPTTTAKTVIDATINAVMDEANGKVILTVQSKTKINKVIYNWNTSTEVTIDGQSQMSVEKSIDLPSGKNTLNVKVIDIDGNETKQAFEFESEEGNDIILPNITLEVTEDITLLITATDETEMSFLTYRWNDDPETTVEVEEDAEDKTTITVEIEIPKGTNTITVVAVDASEKHNTRTETKSLKGLTKPEIEYNLSEDGVLSFYCTHEKGIKEIYYTLNGVAYGVTYTEETGYPTEASFDQKLEEGYNEIELTVTSTEDAINKFKGQCTVNSQEEANTDSENTNTENSNSENETNDTNTASSAE